MTYFHWYEYTSVAAHQLCGALTSPGVVLSMRSCTQNIQFSVETRVVWSTSTFNMHLTGAVCMKWLLFLSQGHELVSLRTCPFFTVVLNCVRSATTVSNNSQSQSGVLLGRAETNQEVYRKQEVWHHWPKYQFLGHASSIAYRCGCLSLLSFHSGVDLQRGLVKFSVV